ncbi:MAG: hypothetical protein IT457_19070, partial [Planctomycetes bacterium]|nr:hypothetical protein [Planctomycetota bacterium]
MPRVSPHRCCPLAIALLLGVAANSPAQQSGGAVLVESSRTDVVVLSPSAQRESEDSQRLGQLVQGCRKRLDVSAADSAAFVSTLPTPLPMEVAGLDLIVLAVLPDQASLVDCDDERTLSTIAAARGLRVTLDTTYVPDRDIVQVIVRRGETVLRPVDERRELVRRLGPGMLRTPGNHWIRLAFDVSALAPDARGAVDDLTIEVRSAAGGTAERFALPWSAVRQTWERGIAARNPALALGALYSPGVSREARRDARATSGFALMSVGDTVGARIVLAGLLAAEPCFTVAASEPAPMREAVQALDRPSARCAAQRPLVTVGRALVMPGFGRASRRAVAQRTMLAAGLVTGAWLAVRQSTVANERYADYLAVQTFP